MRKSLVATALLGAVLFLSACSDDEFDGGPAVKAGTVIDKGGDKDCPNRLTLLRTDMVKNKKTKKKEARASIGYVCVQDRTVWQAYKIGDHYQ